MTQQSSSLIPHPSSLRWWGWGTLEQSYDLDRRPNFWPILRTRLGVSGDVICPPVEMGAIDLPQSRLSPRDLADLERIFGVDGVRVDRLSRILHAGGKSYRDLIRIRRGEVEHPPDAVVYPGSEAQIGELFAWAKRSRARLIPFGGGSSVTGGVEPVDRPPDVPAITLDLARLNRVISIDRASHTATAQCGIFGPALEAALNAEGFTLGHFPQSFEFSTLGGWLATRSAGQTSTGYGKIEDMVERVRLVAPRGCLDVKPLPASAAGPDVLQMLIGSEGMLGVIVEATMRIRPLPEARDYRGVLFHSFEDGAGAIRELMQRGVDVAMARLSDAEETNVSIALTRAPGTRGARLGMRAGQWIVHERGYGFDTSCLMMLGIEGEQARVKRVKKAALEVCKRHGGMNIGQSAGRSWLRERFALPYLRDDLLDRGIMIDTVETAATWSNLPGVYVALKGTLEQAIAATGATPLVMTHLSHSYRDGASLYSTFVGAQRGDPIEQWQPVKRAATEAILAHGGALSHHHGVGRDHAAWLARQHSALAVEAFRALKATFDPEALLNPGVLGVGEW